MQKNKSMGLEWVKDKTLLKLRSIGLLKSKIKFGKISSNTQAFVELTIGINSEEKIKIGSLFMKNMKEVFLYNATSSIVSSKEQSLKVMIGFRSKKDAKIYVSSNLHHDHIIQPLTLGLNRVLEVAVHTIIKKYSIV